MEFIKKVHYHRKTGHLPLRLQNSDKHITHTFLSTLFKKKPLGPLLHADGLLLVLTTNNVQNWFQNTLNF